MLERRIEKYSLATRKFATVARQQAKNDPQGLKFAADPLMAKDTFPEA